MLQKIKTSVKLEFKYLGRVKKPLIYFILFTVLVVLLQRYLILPILPSTIHGGVYWEIALLIFTNNTLAYLLIAYGTYIIFYEAPLISRERCRQVRLPDCKIWMSIIDSWKTRLILTLIFIPILLVLMLYTSLRIESSIFHVNVELKNVLLWGVYKIYGIFELSGETMALLSQVPGKRNHRAILFTLGLVLLLVGALIESRLIIGG
ncbi:MAG: hypothetical protein F7B60_02695 [Desulfurococcales archaeon]|nr:hypothetical protein [Desulfurococcales archaeon]